MMRNSAGETKPDLYAGNNSRHFFLLQEIRILAEAQINSEAGWRVSESWTVKNSLGISFRTSEGHSWVGTRALFL